jgi:hypothetical protein
MLQPPLNVTVTQPHHGVWHVSLNGRRVGKIIGALAHGFTARDMNHRRIGTKVYLSAEAAMQAWVPVAAAILDPLVRRALTAPVKDPQAAAE